MVVVGQPEPLNSPDLFDVNVGARKEGDRATSDEARLFAHRNGAGPNDVVVYFVRSTIPPSNGCSWHWGPAPRWSSPATPTFGRSPTKWGTFSGLSDVDDSTRLMDAKATDRPGGVAQPLPRAYG